MGAQRSGRDEVMEGPAPCLVIDGVTKVFPGVVALDEVSFMVRPGEIHAMVGENGAGKSTLMHVIAGVYAPDQGSMEIDGISYSPEDEKDAQNSGVAIVFQEGTLFPQLSITENIFAGRQPASKLGLVDFKSMREATSQLLSELDLHISPDTVVEDLSPSQRQLVEIAKALSQQVRILILDEPTSSLTISEARHLFEILNKLAARGVAIVFVTHRLAEVFEVADRVTVLRDGKVTGVRDIDQTNADELIHLEVGRELSFEPVHVEKNSDAPIVLEVENLAVGPVEDASFKVHSGEIVCLAGLVGAGRTELCESIFGIRRRTAGRVIVNGIELYAKHPRDAMQVGIGMVPEDRREAGLFLAMSIAQNISASNLESVSKNGIVRNADVRTLAEDYSSQLNIITPSIDREVMFLSGGNQQKVLLAKWLARRPLLLIVDEPTKGVDVGAKAELYRILRDLAKNDVALLVVSSDLPEVLSLAHRIIVMSKGRTVGEIDPRVADEVSILQMATPLGAIREGEQD